MKKWVKIVFSGIAAILVVTLLVSASVKHAARTCSRLEVTVDADHHFITPAEVELLVMNVLKKKDKPVEDIDIPRIERLLKNHPFISRAEVYRTLNGTLKVDVLQRKPLLRFLAEKETFYIDNEGLFMPVSPDYTAHVPVATGNIRGRYIDIPRYNIRSLSADEKLASLTMMDDLFYVAETISRSDFWSRCIQQLDVDEKKEIILIPVIGDHKIVLGDTTRLQEKLDDLLLFYRKGLNSTGWSQYKTINAKYSGQIVCEKK